MRGSAVNQDGRTLGITAPSKQSQEMVIKQAIQRAGKYERFFLSIHSRNMRKEIAADRSLVVSALRLYIRFVTKGYIVY